MPKVQAVCPSCEQSITATPGKITACPHCQYPVDVEPEASAPRITWTSGAGNDVVYAAATVIILGVSMVGLVVPGMLMLRAAHKAPDEIGWAIFAGFLGYLTWLVLLATIALLVVHIARTLNRTGG